MFNICLLEIELLKMTKIFSAWNLFLYVLIRFYVCSKTLKYINVHKMKEVSLMILVLTIIKIKSLPSSILHSTLYNTCLSSYHWRINTTFSTSTVTSLRVGQCRHFVYIFLGKSFGQWKFLISIRRFCFVINLNFVIILKYSLWYDKCTIHSFK